MSMPLRSIFPDLGAQGNGDPVHKDPVAQPLQMAQPPARHAGGGPGVVVALSQVFVAHASLEQVPSVVRALRSDPPSMASEIVQTDVRTLSRLRDRTLTVRALP
jgi:hypothetical protein